MSERTAPPRPVLLLSDLHLPLSPSPLRESFLHFLAGPAREAQAVYILGDLFEAWIGDDVGLRHYADEARALNRLSESGVAVFVQRGNRDFLLGPRFVQATGVKLLDDPVVIDLCGTPTLLSHGDQWCTDDHAYQRWRRFAHDARAQAAFLFLPRRLRVRIASGLRKQSSLATRDKPLSIMDVNPHAIAAAFNAYGVERIIHGHTHRPDTHRDAAMGRIRVRIVLADWRADRKEILRFDSGQPARRILL